MNKSSGRSWFQRITASIVLIAFTVSCTHMPSGEKAFKTFDECVASNLALATLGGVGIGALAGAFTKQATGSSSAGRTVGAAAGIAAGAMIALTAWRKCAAVYNTSEAVPQQGGHQQAPLPPPAQRKPRLSLDKLDVRVEGSENDAPIPEFNFSFFSENPSAKDIKAQFRHKVEIVRFTAGDGDKLVLADAQGNPMSEGGRQIPLENASRMSRDRLNWVTIAEDGKDDYTEDVIIQQGQRTTYRHKLQVPPRAQLALPLPVPMRYSLTVQAEGMKSSRTVDFALLPTSDRPKRYAAAGAVSSGESSSDTAIATRGLSDKSSSAASGASYVTKSRASLFSDTSPKRRVVASLKPGTKVSISNRSEIKAGGSSVEWAQVVPESGAGGWLPMSELKENK
ncbi:hypothetical protein BH11PSE11_BH11PSE11_14490 [soil metagenome]